jgi:hypothetical protein
MSVHAASFGKSTEISVQCALIYLCEYFFPFLANIFLKPFAEILPEKKNFAAIFGEFFLLSKRFFSSTPLHEVDYSIFSVHQNWKLKGIVAPDSSA